MLTNLNNLINKYNPKNIGYINVTIPEIYNLPNVKQINDTNYNKYDMMIIQTNNVDYSLINNFIGSNKTVILIVDFNFDFEALVLNTDANSIDAISWKNSNGQRSEPYLVVINKN